MQARTGRGHAANIATLRPTKEAWLTLTYVSWFLVEQRAATTPLQQTRFWLIHFSSAHVVLAAFNSASVLLEFTSYNNLKLVNTPSPHKSSRHWTWPSWRGDYHNHIDYIMVKQHFQSSVNIAKTGSFPGVDIGSDHELVMMAFRLCLQRVKNQGSIRIRFSLETLNVPNMEDIFRATIGRKFAPLLALENQDIKIDSLINSFSTAVTETANNILSKHQPAKKPWVTDCTLKLCDKWRELKQKKNTIEGAKFYREANQ